jgi:hypothetical protein
MDVVCGVIYIMQQKMAQIRDLKKIVAHTWRNLQVVEGEVEDTVRITN